ncbi:MAG: dTDP-4-dehydrorhamnose reductase [Methylobacillus sp.]|jgi:dTDP-4-dehydrorhamnose reductase|nr:dTDP-4-dehydrorhamnose reductase [Methylobacillus sp.]
MNILVLGSRGQVGWELSRSLLPLGHVIALSREQLDLADVSALCDAVQSARPALIVNAAAYTAVDKAESEVDAAIKANAVAPSILAEEAARIGALLIHYSTDYVFDGNSAKPYTETDATLPLGVYGRSKLAGEQAIAASGCDHLILRTSWVYGARGQNFMRTMLRLAQERETLRVVADQTGAPTWARWIADATAQIAFQAQQKRAAQMFASGLYHLTCSGATTWHGFADEIISGYRQLHPQTPLTARKIEAITTAEYPTPARRPANSRLDCARIAADYGITCPDWKDALALCLREL